jgi:hypothetical protein
MNPDLLVIHPLVWLLCSLSWLKEMVGIWINFIHNFVVLLAVSLTACCSCWLYAVNSIISKCFLLTFTVGKKK